MADFFPIPDGVPKAYKCASGPHTINQGTGRYSDTVPVAPSIDDLIANAEQRCLYEAANKAAGEAASALKAMKATCTEPCRPRVVITLSDPRYQEETGHSSGGEVITTTIRYLISAEVDWTLELYCENDEAPQENAPKKGHDDDDDTTWEHLSASGTKTWVKITRVSEPGGCKSKHASGKADGKGSSGPPFASAAAAATEAKEAAVDDAIAQIKESVAALSCDKRCKKQKTTIQLTHFVVTSYETRVYGGQADGFGATAYVHWVAESRCSEP